MQLYPTGIQSYCKTERNGKKYTKTKIIQLMCFGLDDGKCDDVFIGVLIARGLPARGLMASSSTQRWWRCWWQWWWWWKTLYPDVIISSSIMGDDRNEDIASCLKIIYRLASFYHDIALAIKFTNRPLNFKSHKSLRVDWDRMNLQDCQTQFYKLLN